ncbi:hypothetical protein IJ732_08400 [bacterium]|nr:hypothetical protein [bacterium]
MKEAFSHNQKVTLNPEAGQEQKNNQQRKKKTPVKKETLQKLVDMGVDIKSVFYEEDAQALIEEKDKDKKPEVKRDKKEQLQFEVNILAGKLEIPVSDSVGIKGTLDAIKAKIDNLKTQAGHDLEKMAEALSYEVSYKAIKTDYEVYHNTTNLLGASSLASYNMIKLNLRK